MDIRKVVDVVPEEVQMLREVQKVINDNKEVIEVGNLSDGFHTFNELYRFRKLYNAMAFNEWKDKKEFNVHKSKHHNDGEEPFGGGWFIVMATLPTGQISNHYELEDWDLFNIPEKEKADKWDGHTPQQSLDRMEDFLLNY